MSVRFVRSVTADLRKPQTLKEGHACKDAHGALGEHGHPGRADEHPCESGFGVRAFFVTLMRRLGLRGTRTLGGSQGCSPPRPGWPCSPKTRAGRLRCVRVGCERSGVMKPSHVNRGGAR